MKKILLALGLLSMMVGSRVVGASPMYYTFKGTVDSYRDFGLSSNTLLNIGDSTTYIFKIDFNEKGFVELYSGSIEYLDDNPEYAIDFFYSKYISGSILPINGTPHSSSNFTSEHVFGWSETPTPDYHRGILRAGADDNLLSIENLSLSVQEWSVGTSVSFWNAQYDNAGGWGEILGTALLIDISASPPVPEPTAMLLSCSGFEPPMDNGPVKVKKNNRALPLKAQLFDRDGFAVTNQDIVAPPVLQVLFISAQVEDAVDVTKQALAPGLGTEGNQFVFTHKGKRELGKWEFNLKLKNYSAPGTYQVFMDSGDSSEYLIEPKCSSSFIVK